MQACIYANFGLQIGAVQAVSREAYFTAVESAFSFLIQFLPSLYLSQCMY